jgi:hypothetical protein
VSTVLPARVCGRCRHRHAQPGELASVARWTRVFHEAVASFLHRAVAFLPVSGASVIGQNDIGPYNVCLDGDELVGVFNWDSACPITPLLEPAFIAWRCVPLWREIGPQAAVRRLTFIAATYKAVAGNDAAAVVRSLNAVKQADAGFETVLAFHGISLHLHRLPYMLLPLGLA